MAQAQNNMENDAHKVTANAINEEKQENNVQADAHSDVRKAKARKVAAAVFGTLAAVLVVGYISVAVYYSTHFFPGTIVNGIVCDNIDQNALMARLMLQLQDYRLEVAGRNLRTMEKDQLVALSATDMDLYNSVDGNDVKNLLANQGNWLWPQIFMNKERKYTLQSEAVISETKLVETLKAIDAFQENKMTAPSDAYVAGYSEEEKKYVLSPEVKGTLLDMSKVYEVIRQAVAARQEMLDLDEAGCYVPSAVTAESRALQRKLEEANKWLQTNIRYDWNGAEIVVADEQVRQWVLLEEEGPILDEEAIATFVAENAQEYDTYRKNRTFHTTLGYDLDLKGGAFGWKTDREVETAALIELIHNGSVCDREPEYASTAPEKGQNDIGNSYVEVDLTHQHLYLYQDGEIVVESELVSGNMRNGHRTPEGVYGLTYKTKNATLRGADYVSHVNYWMPFNGNVGMHDATWRSSFGGEIYKTSGSHGCVNLPLNKAAEIYPYVSKGFPVICYYYPEGMLPEETAEAVAASANPAETTGETPQGSDMTGETPQSSETTGETPQSSETTGETPQSSETTGEPPQSSETTGEPPQGSDVTGEIPQGSETMGESQ